MTAGAAERQIRLAAGLSLTCLDLRHVYRSGEEEVTALDGLSFAIGPGETAAVLGPSGCGKSTLLAVLAGLMRPTSGRVLAGTDDVTAMTITELADLRANRVGMVVQNPGRSLLPYATAEENVYFARRGVRRSRRTELPAPDSLLAALDLTPLGHRPVRVLSGGEQQRVAVAVGLAGAPGLLLADEPTSQLDEANRDALVVLLRRVAERLGTTVLTVTHDEVVGEAHGRMLRLRAGRLSSDEVPEDTLTLVASDGSVRLPDALRQLLPPGTPVRVTAAGDGVVIRPHRPEDR